ncbi:MAG: hypothetical protein A3K03_13325 [Bdellovibrionales bacterium RIFOXYD1_FULL_44_7]|nr:MAG: hypothetical protein A3K03_13325 [Bdellovibrionales bacterium RIFOXYD1_FULL_44_7]
MAIRTLFASLSFSASVDQQTGSMSVFDVVDELRVPQLPIHLQSFVISLILEKTSSSEKSGKLFIHLLTPDGKQATVGSGEMQFPAEQRKLKAIFRFGGFPINQFGDHRFVVSWLDKAGVKQGEAILDFSVVQATQVAQGAPQSSGKPEFPN